MSKRPAVVHCMRQQCTHYCGRPQSIGKAIGNPIDASILGNPYPMGCEDDRESVINSYRVWLWKKLQRGGQELEVIESLTESSILGCFCAPKACHCNVIADAWAWLKSLP